VVRHIASRLENPQQRRRRTPWRRPVTEPATGPAATPAETRAADGTATAPPVADPGAPVTPATLAARRAGVRK
jgi:shikimate kinase